MGKERDEDFFRLGALPDELSERGREVWLAGLGAFATVEEEGSKLFNSLVKRGEKMEERGKETVEESRKELEQRQKDASKSVEESANRAEDVVSRTMQHVMDRLDVPSRKEVMNLAERVELLSKQIDELSISLETDRRGRGVDVDVESNVGAKTTYHVQSRDGDWAVIKEGADRATSTHETKKEAVESGRELAKNHAPSLLVLHKQSGDVQETLSYEATE